MGIRVPPATTKHPDVATLIATRDAHNERLARQVRACVELPSLELYDRFRALLGSTANLTINMPLPTEQVPDSQKGRTTIHVNADTAQEIEAAAAQVQGKVLSLTEPMAA
ncbi:MAG: hypothetical protein PHI23_01510 [Candidatus Peribacteraceae bacterium]|nr:hypothetical protein [Candidatus Peribacteraceae bacterium]